MSSNIRNKKYVFENEQLTKEEYEKKMKLVNMGNRIFLEDCKQRFRELIRKSLNRATVNLNIGSSVAEATIDCRNGFFVIYSQDVDNVRYGDDCIKLRDSMDVTNAMGEKVYESTINLSSNILFSAYNRNCSFLEYCVNCFNCHNCFGCVGLKNKEFHIFNQPYEEPEYWKTVDRIKTEMLVNGEYGEFFPLSLGLYPYQVSNAQIYFPLDEKRSAEQKIPWYEEPEINIPPDSRVLKTPQEVPADIKEVSDGILKEVIICEKTKKPFRITASELAFYRKMNLPVPTKHPWQRLTERFAFERNVWLYPFVCPSCQKAFYSSFTPEQQKELAELVCEPCYLKKVVT